MIHNGRHAIVALLIVGVVAGACQPEPQPEPTPDPGPVYQPIPPEWCGQLQLDELLARFDLSADPDPYGSYNAYHSRLDASCSLRAEGVTDHLATHRQRLSLGGSVVYSVYHDPSEARNQHHLMALSYEDDAEGVIVRPVDGWWEEGHYNEYTTYSRTYDRPDLGPISNVIIHYVAYDRNVVVQLTLHAEAYEQAREELSDLLHGLARAVLDDAANHLELSE